VGIDPKRVGLHSFDAVPAARRFGNRFRMDPNHKNSTSEANSYPTNKTGHLLAFCETL
jgi:hypothetical protein